MQDIPGFDALREVSPGAFAVVFLAGLAMGIAPPSYALYPVIGSFVAGDDERSAPRGLALSLAFVLGSATVDASLGTLFGFVGGVVLEVMARYLAAWNLLAALLLALLGMALLRVVRVRWPTLRMTWRRAHTLPGAYALGVPFGLTTCPACTPMVLPILAAAAATGSWWFGGLLMAVFGVARGLPLVAVGVGAGLVDRIRVAGRWVPRIERAAGFLLLAGAGYFLVQAVRIAMVSWF